MPFAPQGQLSRRASMIDLFRGQEDGVVVSYEAIYEALGTDDRAIAQIAISRARPVLERRFSRTLVSVPLVGYRVVARPAADEIADLRKRIAVLESRSAGGVV